MADPKTYAACGVTDDGDEAWCAAHLAEQTGQIVEHVRERASGHYTTGALTCGARLRDRKVLALGTILDLDLDARWWA